MHPRSIAVVSLNTITDLSESVDLGVRMVSHPRRNGVRARKRGVTIAPGGARVVSRGCPCGSIKGIPCDIKGVPCGIGAFRVPCCTKGVPRGMGDGKVPCGMGGFVWY